MKYKYETHLHTYPVSKCGRFDVETNLKFYKSLGYDGVFVTNHFIDGNINCDRTLPYREQIEFYCSDYEKAAKFGKQIGIKVFFGIEMSVCHGTDFLVYGLDKDWLLNNQKMMELPPKDRLDYLRQNGALVIQAHPYREASYIEYFRLFPRNVDGVEVLNASNTDEENQIAEYYAAHYDLTRFAGSDNHRAGGIARLGGVELDFSLESEAQFVQAIKQRKHQVFLIPNEKAACSQ